MIDLIVRSRPRSLGGFDVNRLLPFAKRRMVGPFVFFDHLGPVDFPRRHPARPSTCGRIRTSGSRPSPTCSTARSCIATASASEQAIRPGEVNWMTAGRGITHSERFERARAKAACTASRPGWRCRRSMRSPIPPSRITAADLPTYEGGGLWARLVAGEAFGAKAAVKTHSPMFYVHWRLDARREGAASRRIHANARPLSSSGPVEVEGERHEAGKMLIFSAGEPVLFTAAEPSVVMLLGGEPIGPRFIEWNFVSSSKERIEQAKADWRAGRMKLPDLDDRNSFRCRPIPRRPIRCRNTTSFGLAYEKNAASATLLPVAIWETAMQRLTVLLALFAGLLGGIVSGYLVPQLLPQRVQTAVPAVVAAQRFVLVDSAGNPAGFFAVGTPARQQGTAIVLYDAEGREIWRASDSVRPLTVAQ